jgi:hypothetical protein
MATLSKAARRWKTKHGDALTMIASLEAPLCFWWGTAKALRTLICMW